MNDNEMNDIVNNRSLSESNWYKWSDWLNSHIPESVKRSLSHIKKLYEAL